MDGVLVFYCLELLLLGDFCFFVPVVAFFYYSIAFLELILAITGASGSGSQVITGSYVLWILFVFKAEELASYPVTIELGGRIQLLLF